MAAARPQPRRRGARPRFATGLVIGRRLSAASRHAGRAGDYATQRSVRTLELHGALHAGSRADFLSPALEIRHAFARVGHYRLRAHVAGIEREIGDGELLARRVLARAEEVVPH